MLSSNVGEQRFQSENHTGVSFGRNMSKYKYVTTEICQNKNMSQLKYVKLEICQNRN